jgi:hypothetical protein
MVGEGVRAPVSAVSCCSKGSEQTIYEGVRANIRNFLDKNYYIRSDFSGFLISTINKINFSLQELMPTSKLGSNTKREIIEFIEIYQKNRRKFLYNTFPKMNKLIDINSHI